MKDRQSQKLKTKDVHMRIPEPLYGFLVKESVEHGISQSLYLTHLLQAQFEKTEKEKRLSKSSRAPQKGASFHLEWSELTDDELEEMLGSFEQKYHLDSEIFYKRYRKGQADNIEDRILWGSLYALKKETL